MQPTTGIRPDYSQDELLRVARELYGVDGAIEKELPSYEDRNFQLRAIDGQRWVLKVLNSMYTAMAYFEAQDDAMLELLRAGVRCSEPLASPFTGARCNIIDWPLPPGPLHHHHQQQQQEEASSSNPSNAAGGGRKHIVRMLRFLEGDVLETVPQSPHLWRSLGCFMGRVSAALRGFDRPALHTTHAWHMPAVAASIAARLPHVAAFSEPQRALVEAVLRDWEAAQPQLAGLRWQVCHTDANEANTLVRLAQPGEAGAAGPAAGGQARVVVDGLIDFGDLCYTWAVVELAHTVCYAMLLAADRALQGREGAELGPLEAARRAGDLVRAGYEEACAVEEAEAAALPLLIRARVALSLTMGAFTAASNPDNAAYLLTTQRPGWALLEGLSSGAQAPQAVAGSGADADA